MIKPGQQIGGGGKNSQIHLNNQNCANDFYNQKKDNSFSNVEANIGKNLSKNENSNVI
jgi:hypothetical protein